MDMPTREKLAQMFFELSEDALHYVWRPIVYAYTFVKSRNPECLTDEDAYRLDLIGAAANWSAEKVEELDRWILIIDKRDLRREK